MDTIVAISSPPGAAAQAVVRVSGPRSLAVAARLASLHPEALGEIAGFSARSCVLDLNGATIDASLATFRAPRSYTGEDLVEISLIGSVPLLALLLRVARATGDDVRLARPGEFTLRAFLNGKLDAAQVEAVGRLLHAAGEAEARAAYRQVGGLLRESVEPLVEELIGTLALLEAGLDFPDEDLPAVAPAALAARLGEHLAALSQLLEHTALRIPARGAVKAVLVGVPNAGKSSLLNALAGVDAAIVSAQRGTTRDPLRAVTLAGERSIEWVDLAGIEDEAWTLAAVPATGRGGVGEEARRMLGRISRRELETADVVIWVADAHELNRTVGDVHAPDVHARGFAALPATQRLLVATKSDLLDRAALRTIRSLPEGPLLVSSRTGAGLPDLVARVLSLSEGDGAAGDGVELTVGGAEGTLLLSPLQEAQLRDAGAALENARAALRRAGAPELAAIDLREAIERLRSFAGGEVSERVLGAVFAQFCVGK